MKNILSLLGILVLLLALAQDEVSQERIISIESSGGNQNGNIRYGPINYEHPEPDGVVATVSTLTIFSSTAQLRGPAEAEGEERLTLAQAQGQREATFTGGVNVERGRLTATGPDLFYSETEGLGTLTGGTEIVVAPRSDAATPIEGAEGEVGEAAEAPVEGEEAEVIGEEAEEATDETSEEAEIEDAEAEEAASEEVETEEASSEETATEETATEETATEEAPSDIAQGEPVVITAEETLFDVDTDVSTSRGNVNLINGNQTAQAEEIEYEEERTLGVLRNEGGQVTVTRIDEDGTELVITADEIRAETDSKQLYAIGNAVVVDGGITTSGEEVFYNDEASRALVLGDPAVSEDTELGQTTTGSVLEQRTDIDSVRVYSDAIDFDQEQFQLTSEAGGEG